MAKEVGSVSFNSQLVLDLSKAQQQVSNFKNEIKGIGADSQLGRNMLVKLKPIETLMNQIVRMSEQPFNSTGQVERYTNLVTALQSRVEDMGEAIDGISHKQISFFNLSAQDQQKINNIRTQITEIDKQIKSVPKSVYDDVFSDSAIQSALQLANATQGISKATKENKSGVRELGDYFANAAAEAQLLVDNAQKAADASLVARAKLAKHADLKADMQSEQLKFMDEPDADKVNFNYFQNKLRSFSADKALGVSGWFGNEAAAQIKGEMSAWIGGLTDLLGTETTKKMQDMVQEFKRNTLAGQKADTTLYNKIANELMKTVPEALNAEQSLESQYDANITKVKELLDVTEKLNQAREVAAAPETQEATKKKELEAKKIDLQNQEKEVKQNFANEVQATSKEYYGGIKTGAQVAASSVNNLSAAMSQNQQTLANTNYLDGVITRFFSLQTVINSISRAIRTMINTISELDAQMNEIAVVTDMTTDDLWKQMDAYTQLAQIYGTTIKGAYEVSTLYYQMGLTQQEVMAATAETLKMSAIANMDYAETTDALTVAVRGFKLEFTEASRVVDVYSAVAASTASDTEELATAMSKVASGAANVGASFENTTAMLATMISTTRESAQNLGSALKSVISRFGELKSSSTTDENGEAIDANKTETALKSVNIALRDSVGQFRDFDDVIIELASKWDTLDKNSQRYIATVAAGNRQQSRFIALVSDYDSLRANIETAANAEDAALIQYSKTLDSIETKTRQLNTSFQNLYAGLGLESVFKTLLDYARQFVDALSDDSPVEMINTVFQAVQGIKLILMPLIDSLKSSLQETIRSTVGTTEQEINKIAVTISQKISDAIREGFSKGATNGAAVLNKVLPTTTSGSTKTPTDQSTQNTEKQGLLQYFSDENNAGKITRLTSQLNGLGAVVSMVAGGFGKGGEAVGAFAKGITGLAVPAIYAFSTAGRAAFEGNAVGAILTIISAVISLGSAVRELIALSAGPTLEELQETAEKTKIAAATSKTEMKSVEAIKTKYEQLAKARNTSNEAEQEFIDYQNEIADKYPELIGYIDSEGNSVLTLANNYNKLAKEKTAAYASDYAINAQAQRAVLEKQKQSFYQREASLDEIIAMMEPGYTLTKSYYNSQNKYALEQADIKSQSVNIRIQEQYLKDISQELKAAFSLGNFGKLDNELNNLTDIIATDLVGTKWGYDNTRQAQNLSGYTYYDTTQKKDVTGYDYESYLKSLYQGRLENWDEYFDKYDASISALTINEKKELNDIAANLSTYTQKDLSSKLNQLGIFNTDADNELYDIIFTHFDTLVAGTQTRIKETLSETFGGGKPIERGYNEFYDSIFDNILPIISPANADAFISQMQDLAKNRNFEVGKDFEQEYYDFILAVSKVAPELIGQIFTTDLTDLDQLATLEKTLIDGGMDAEATASFISSAQEFVFGTQNLILNAQSILDTMATNVDKALTSLKATTDGYSYEDVTKLISKYKLSYTDFEAVGDKLYLTEQGLITYRQKLYEEQTASAKKQLEVINEVIAIINNEGEIAEGTSSAAIGQFQSILNSAKDQNGRIDWELVNKTKAELEAAASNLNSATQEWLATLTKGQIGSLLSSVKVGEYKTGTQNRKTLELLLQSFANLEDVVDKSITEILNDGFITTKEYIRLIKAAEKSGISVDADSNSVLKTYIDLYSKAISGYNIEEKALIEKEFEGATFSFNEKTGSYYASNIPGLDTEAWSMLTEDQQEYVKAQLTLAMSNYAESVVSSLISSSATYRTSADNAELRQQLLNTGKVVEAELDKYFVDVVGIKGKEVVSLTALLDNETLITPAQQDEISEIVLSTKKDFLESYIDGISEGVIKISEEEAAKLTQAGIKIEKFGAYTPDEFGNLILEATFDGAEQAIEDFGAAGIDDAKIKDELNNAAKKIVSNIVAALGGKGTNQQLASLQRISGLDDISKYTSKTYDGIKLSYDGAIQLIAKLQGGNKELIGQIQNELITNLEDYVASAEDLLSVENSIADIQKQIAESNEADNIILKEKLAIYQQFYALQSSAKNDDFNFMGEDLQGNLSNAITFGDSARDAFKSIDEAVSAGEMSIQDYKNIMDQLIRTAKDADMAAALQSEAYTTIAKANREGGKVAMTGLKTGAEQMKAGLVDSVHQTAQAQIKWIDAQIAQLQAIKAINEAQAEAGEKGASQQQKDILSNALNSAAATSIDGTIDIVFGGRTYTIPAETNTLVEAICDKYDTNLNEVFAQLQKQVENGDFGNFADNSGKPLTLDTELNAKVIPEVEEPVKNAEETVDELQEAEKPITILKDNVQITNTKIDEIKIPLASIATQLPVIASLLGNSENITKFGTPIISKIPTTPNLSGAVTTTTTSNGFLDQTNPLRSKIDVPGPVKQSAVDIGNSSVFTQLAGDKEAQFANFSKVLNNGNGLQQVIDFFKNLKWADFFQNLFSQVDWEKVVAKKADELQSQIDDSPALSGIAGWLDGVSRFLGTNPIPKKEAKTQDEEEEVYFDKNLNNKTNARSAAKEREAVKQQLEDAKTAVKDLPEKIKATTAELDAEYAIMDERGVAVSAKATALESQLTEMKAELASAQLLVDSLKVPLEPLNVQSGGGGTRTNQKRKPGIKNSPETPELLSNEDAQVAAKNLVEWFQKLAEAGSEFDGLSFANFDKTSNAIGDTGLDTEVMFASLVAFTKLISSVPNPQFVEMLSLMQKDSLDQTEVIGNFTTQAKVEADTLREIFTQLFTEISTMGASTSLFDSLFGTTTGVGTEEQITLMSSLKEIVSSLAIAWSASFLITGYDEAQSELATLVSLYDQLQNKTINIKVNTGNSAGALAGTAAISGLAAASGKNQAQASSLRRKTLVGELGAELAVYDDMYHILGKDGAEFVELPDNAIVFNHLQTKKILKGSSSVRGRAMAGGNVPDSGPARASIDETIANLQGLRKVWQDLLTVTSKDLAQQAGGGGGGGGGDAKAYTQDLQEWYNLLRQIKKIETDIKNIEAERKNLTDGREYVSSLKQQRSLLEEQQKIQEKLLVYQQKQVALQAKEINNNKIWSKLFNVNTQTGLLQYNVGNEANGGKGALQQLAELNAMKSSKDQVAYLKKLGYSATGDDGKALTGEELVKQFFEDIDKIIEEYDSLYDTVHDTYSTIEELQSNITAIDKEIIDNQKSLEQEVYDALAGAIQKQIDALTEQKELIQEANNTYIKGIQDAMNKEKEKYSQTQDIAERQALQRRLALLQRSGGSASEIASLQKEIDTKFQDEYFQKLQDQIDAVQEASDKQIETMERQINIQSENLEYQKMNNILWQKTYDVLALGDSSILEVLINGSDENIQKSTLSQKQMLEDWAKEIGIYKGNLETDAAGRTNGYDANGYDSNGFNAAGIHKDTGTKYNSLGYDKDGNKESATAQSGSSSTDTTEKTQKTKYYHGTYRGKSLTYSSKSALEKKIKSLYQADQVKAKDSKSQAALGAMYSAALSSIRYYSSGGKNDYTGLAMLHGTKQSPEGILSAADYASFKDMVAAYREMNTNNFNTTFDTSIASFVEAMRDISNLGGFTIEKGAINIELSGNNDRELADMVGETVEARILNIAKKQGITRATRGR